MRKVMIVDDAAFMRISIRKALEKEGYEIVGEAENGKVAIKKYTELKPDIVILDITMPEMDGITALKEIKKIDEDAKVLIVSAMGQESYIREAIMHGAKNFIVKPFDNKLILKTLEKI